jgi:hypothetical protein
VNRAHDSLAKHRIVSWEQLVAYRQQYGAVSRYAIADPWVRVDTARPLGETLASLNLWFKEIDQHQP